MMLDHLGENDASRRLMNAVERVTAGGTLTPDLGGNAKTVDVTKAVRKAILEAAKSGTQQLQPLKQS
jgi:tartrate dehydrogenase/decarboxylase/D-malate dehydrogenase